MRAMARTAVLIAALLPLGCGAPSSDVGPVSEDSEDDVEMVTLPLDPATFMLRVRTALAETGSFEVVVAHPGRGEGESVEGVWHAGPGSDREGDEMSWADADSSPGARHWVRADGRLCLDGPARADMAAAGAGSVVVVPARPWGCAATEQDASLIALAGRPVLAWSPVHRLAAVGTPTQVEHVGVEETDGETLDHYRFVSAPGVLDPVQDAEETTYDVWLDADQRLRVMEVAGERWELADFGAAAPVTLPDPRARGDLRRASGGGVGSFRP